MPQLFQSSGQTGSPDQDSINQKKKMAQMLQMMAMQPDPNAANNPAIVNVAAPIMKALGAWRMDRKANKDQEALNASRMQDWEKIMKAAQGTPEQNAQVPVATGLPTVDDEGNQMPAIPTKEQVTPAVPGSREQIVQAMLQARDPQLRMAGANQLLQPPQARWEQMQGPRGSLLQRNAVTGELKKVVDTTDPKLMDMLAAQLGNREEAKTDPNAPWKNIRDPKKADEARTRFGAAADTRVAKEQEDVGTARQLINDLERFEFLNQSNSTGGKYKIPGAQFIGTAVSDDVAEMKAITDKMTPMMRQGMPGAASDRDVAMFRGATVGLEKPKEANANIALGLKAAAQNKVDRANFIAEYVTQYGHDRGADAQWKRYLEANPIFDPKAETGSYQINENRMNYQDWLASGGKPVKGPGNIAPAKNNGVVTVDW